MARENRFAKRANAEHPKLTGQQPQKDNGEKNDSSKNDGQEKNVVAKPKETKPKTSTNPIMTAPPKKRAGRPTTADAKTTGVTIRLTKEDIALLKRAVLNGTAKDYSDGVRQAIRTMYKK